MTTVIWIDWYSYHVSRFRALFEHKTFDRQVTGIELVGGCGVHRGLRFRDGDRAELPILSLFPDADWDQAGQLPLARAVWTKLNQLQPSSVLVPGWYTAPAVAAALWARLHGKRSILMSETTEFDHVRVWWKEAVKRFLVWLLFDSAVAGGKPHVRYLQQLGVPSARIAKFYDVVDNRFYADQANRERQSPDPARHAELPADYFLYVGRLAPEKNLARALNAFAQYTKQGGAWSFVLVGDGPERELLQNLTAELGLTGRVFFAGLKNSKETALYYAFARCFVLPSIREPWGLVVNEAMASGLPVLVSNRCGCAEDLVEPGRNGYWFDPADEQQMAACFQKISALTPAERTAMGQSSLQIIDDYSPQNWASEVARLIQPEALQEERK